jgi:hypothetical protein
LSSQQPLGQLAGVQTQEPLRHSVPAGQAMQVTPPVPQCCVLLVLQVLSSQQPLGQLAGVQTQEPFWHSRPAGQLMQATPPVPQAALVFPGWHSLFWQQPPGQLAVVQTHEPLMHVWPALQTLPHSPQLLRSICLLTHWPTCGIAPPGHRSGVPAGQTHLFVTLHSAPVGQQRLEQTRLSGQQNLSVELLWSRRQV